MWLALRSQGEGVGAPPPEGQGSIQGDDAFDARHEAVEVASRGERVRKAVCVSPTRYALLGHMIGPG